MGSRSRRPCRSFQHELDDRIALLSDAKLSALGNKLAAYCLSMGRPTHIVAAEQQLLVESKRAALRAVFSNP